MGFFVQPTGGYYEGDRAHALDVEVPRRPSPLLRWDGQAWVIDTAAQAAALALSNGVAMTQRRLGRLALLDPITALLIQGGLKS